MELVPTIRVHIEKYMREQNLKLQHFSDITGINVGTLSAILNGSRPMSMNQLNQITSAMGLEKGYFYETYGVESFIESSPHWRRLEPYLYECAELGKLHCIQQVITHVTDDRSYIEELFDVAESFFARGLKEAALILYECVADCEKYQHSERLALCQYRIFLLQKTLNKLINLNAAVKFESYIDKLNEEMQLDALKDLANLYSTMNLWDKVFELAEESIRRTDLQIHLQSLRRKRKPRVAFYPLFTYKAYANLHKAHVSGERRQYIEALEYTDIYEDIVNKVNDPTGEEQELIELFKGWAEGNRYLYKILSGDFEVLNDYLDYLDVNHEEISTAFVYIIQAANQYSYNIDYTLSRFENQINEIRTKKYVKLKRAYNEQASNFRYIRLFYELAKYRLNQSQIDQGIDDLITSLQRCVSSNDDMMCIKCIDLYGKYRHFASKTQEEQYAKLIDKLSVPSFR
ncbi:helix-turn-helix domain-containing protein [Paenibacillus silvae]|uniref:helix-turn-helix domain-containing protein n=1 Tax=Paenibacillus silvae TaxID=1325358 RepID=UPI002004B00E|nr:helix-turn-helix transcriptional regulator [Paenibacillus silvae]MCK6077071.1 helix-turn-helix transcriptional regulator [Paenibacillus silvae]MCK6151269.1 helix-turn-helix transcriptional regulator [Paenibacillus silvae]MCK6269757.1 helix-turn-helix transcriptional regulator [Paenibacillus silvae]